MVTNVGAIDRAIRILAGLALIALALGLIPGFAPQIWAWIGVVPLATGLLGNCPAYSILGVSTCQRQT